MELNLDDLLSLEDDQSGVIEYPAEVKGRVLHIDGDFLAYMASFDEGISYQMMQHNTDVMIETLRLLAGASSTCVHLTPSGSTKGGRYEMAVYKEYQGNREGKVKPANLEKIRLYMSNKHNAVMHYDQEADDGLAQANYKAIQEGKRDLTVIVSKDKDLMMVEGLHLDWDTGKIFDVSGFGEISLEGSKIKGTGRKFFWCQMLMGDTADNIPGLLKVAGKDMHRLKPTKDTEKCLEVMASEPEGSPKWLKAKEKYDSRSAFSCGAATTFKIMENIKSDEEAFLAIIPLYINCFKQEKFEKLKKTDDPDEDLNLSWQELFMSNGMLLWMRRVRDPHDFSKFLNTIRENIRKAKDAENQEEGSA